ncbi:MAG: glycoside hydrolase family 2 TIM barrel-domain containing protein [Rikenellaceae bacterium]
MNTKPKMKQYKYILFALLAALPLNVAAQQLFTAQFAPFEIRNEAESGERKLKEYFADYTPQPVAADDTTITVRQIFTLPPKWSDRVITLHTENIALSYDLIINNKKVMSNEDPITPTDINITKYLTQGANRIDLALRDSRYVTLQEGVADNMPQRQRYEGCYLSAQPRARINDFEISLTPDPTAQFATLNIEIMLRNDSNGEESIDVGYDIYDPAGKLLEFSVNNFTVAAQTTDTIKFSPYIYGVNNYKWSPQSPKLYRVMLYVKRNGVITEYIPHKVCFVDVKYVGNQLSNFGERLTLKAENYNAVGSKAQCRKELLAIKSKGHNTIAPSYPQPLWFYELCDELGLWVIDQVSINATASPKDKSVGGTPSNNPALLAEYLRRVEACYSRSRNFGSVVAYSLGGKESGNGYNMYRVYEWMKLREKSLPILYIGAEGEWNSDVID